MKTEGRICVNLCSSVDQLPADFKNRYQLGPLKMTEVEGGQGVMGPGEAKVEHVPLETYDFTSACPIGSESQSTGYRLVDRGKFRKVP